MPKFLVGSLDGKVRSTHEAPLNFSISGKFVVDSPPGLPVRADTDSLTDLVNAKVAAFKAAHPSLQNAHYDELLAVPNVDAAASSRFGTGPDKRTVILPGGSVVTNPLAIAAPTTSVFVHWYGFTLYSEPGALSAQPPPSRLLYNFNPVLSDFEEFSPSTFTVAIRDSANTTTLLTPVPDAEQAFAFGPGSIRLRFTNSSADRIFHLSDWILLYN